MGSTSSSTSPWTTAGSRSTRSSSTARSTAASIQGLAQALFEEAVYDDDGNLKTSTLTEYLVPAASDVPAITTDHTVTPSPTNAMGVKGIGEAGTIGAAPAVINAVVDALSGLGVTDVPMPASPHNVWKAIQAATGGTQ